MNITVKQVLMALAVNIVLIPIVFVISTRSLFAHVWDLSEVGYAALIMAFASLVAGVVCLFIVVIVQKKHLDMKIYFVGQVMVPVLLAGLALYFIIERNVYQNKYGNIDHNREFVEGYGSWDPLESTCRHASLSIL